MSETMAITDPRVHELLAEASAWRVLGLLLERPREGWCQEVEALGRVASDADIRTAADAAREEATDDRNTVHQIGDRTHIGHCRCSLKRPKQS